ncbi:MAG: pyridoxal phosphate-dependent aminotransferase [Candidatus Gracilibacteria bacterium]
MKLYDNLWGFSVEHTNPFQLFSLLQEIAQSERKIQDIVDLSRGDPGYGFSPSVRGREFLSFLLFLDTKLNNPNHLFAENEKEAEKQILEEIAVFAHSAYVPALATRYLNDLSEFIQRCIQIAQGEGVEMSPYDVLFEIFKHSTVSGGTYHDPKGEKLVRMIVAWWHKKTVQTPFSYEDVIFTSGASHAIGTIFKLLGQEGLQFLTHGDKVLISSPVYSPYKTILQRRGLQALSISVDPLTGKVEGRSLEVLNTAKSVKLLILIDPNNPTGFSMDDETMKILAKFAKEQDAIIITDEVYSAFFEDRKSILDLCPERTLRIQARSKIERSTGLRFGDLLICPETNKYLTEVRLKDLLPEGYDFKKAFIFAKGPGGVHGEFQHTTFVTGPDQYLGAAHILLGEEERKKYRETMRKNQEVFCKTLGLPHEGNLYYTMFDMNDVPGCTTQDIPPEQKICDLARLGVIYLPSNLFFSEEDRAFKSRIHTVRASLANGTPDKIKQAAEITRQYLTH